jgi:flagellar motor protein MotB
MRRFGVIATAVLFLLSGATVAIYALQDKPEEEKPAQQEEQAKPEKPQEQAKPKKQEEQAKPGKEDHQSKPAQHAQQEQKTQDRGNNRSARIPDDKFRAHFGRQHTFRIGSPTIVEGQPRFQYGGYWFVIVDPWPVGWLYTDDCYIDYVDGGYFLFEPLHPGVSIAVTVVI